MAAIHYTVETAYKVYVCPRDFVLPLLAKNVIKGWVIKIVTQATFDNIFLASRVVCLY